jgi:hypothetical protein
MPALALGDEHPPGRHLQIPQAQRQHLAAAQPALQARIHPLMRGTLPGHEDNPHIKHDSAFGSNRAKTKSPPSRELAIGFYDRR